MRQGIKQLEPNHFLVDPEDIPDRKFFKELERYPKVVLVVPFDLNRGWKDILITEGYDPVGQYQLTINSVSTVCAKWQKGRIDDDKAFLIQGGWNEIKP
jgi:hypothetical protein